MAMACRKTRELYEKRMDLRFGLMTAHLLSPHVKKGKRLDPNKLSLTIEPYRDKGFNEVKNKMKKQASQAFVQTLAAELL